MDNFSEALEPLSTNTSSLQSLLTEFGDDEFGVAKNFLRQMHEFQALLSDPHARQESLDEMAELLRMRILVARGSISFKREGGKYIEEKRREVFASIMEALEQEEHGQQMSELVFKFEKVASERQAKQL